MNLCHSKEKEIQKLVEHKINVLLEGEKGSGKSTIIKNIAKKLGLEFYTVSMTKQTTLNALLGFQSINGTYIPSQLRKAVEEGGLMLLDEIDAGDPNVLLCLNTLENGYLAFPDGILDVHEDFRLCATSNPASEHQLYTGRSKLDAATLDRFDTVWIDRDPNLEVLLTCEDTAQEIDIMRKVLSDNSMSITLSMRDAIRLFKRKQIGLADGYESVLLSDPLLVSKYNDKLKIARPLKDKKQTTCTSTDELWEVLQKEKRLKGVKSSRKKQKQKPKVTAYDGASTTKDWPTDEWDSIPIPETNTKMHSENYTDQWVRQMVRNHKVANTPLPPGINIRDGYSPEDPFGENIEIMLDDGRKYVIKKDDL